MTTLTFRNRLGELVDVPSVAATRLKNEFGTVLEQAARGAVAITRHDAPKAVLVSYEDFEALVKGKNQNLNDLGAELDALLDRVKRRMAIKGGTSALKTATAQVCRSRSKLVGR